MAVHAQTHKHTSKDKLLMGQPCIMEQKISRNTPHSHVHVRHMAVRLAQLVYFALLSLARLSHFVLHNSCPFSAPSCVPSNPTSRCLVITGMQRYDQIDKDAPFAVAFDKVRKMLLAAIPEFVQAASKWLTCSQALPLSFCASQYCTWINTAWPMERLFVHAIAPLGRQGKASGLSLAHC